MRRETLEAPGVCGQQVQLNAALLRELGTVLRGLDPPFVATLARGSSGHAAAFAKVLIELHVHLPVVSHAPSVGSIYRSTSLRFHGVPVLAISQSGRSPDLVAAALHAKEQGAFVVAVVNDTTSPLAMLADFVVPVRAGPEISVAATKTFIATLAALTQLVAEWAEDAALLDSLGGLEDLLSRAAQADWTCALPELATASGLLVLGRGYTLPIAGEAALKLKEVAVKRAEAFSSAEVAHGPAVLAGPDQYVLVFVPVDDAAAGVRERISVLATQGARVIAVTSGSGVPGAYMHLPVIGAPNAPLAALATAESFYGFANELALRTGHDPDRPSYLAKVTLTN